MKFTISLALLALPVVVNAATITLFAVQTATGFPLQSETYRAEGVGEDGATTYAHEIVFSEVVVGRLNGGTTYTSDGKTVTELPPSSTVTQEPQTIHATLVADASHYVWSVSERKDIDYPNIVVSCTLDGKGGGACVDKLWMAGEPTETASYTGSALPIYTLVSQNTPGSGDDPKNNSATKSGAQLFVAGAVVTLGVVFGFFQGI